MEKARIAQKAPYVLKMKAGKFAWCQCGLSAKQPFCDGSHKTTDFKPIVDKLDKDQTVAFCGCKQSGNAPFCDGSHKNL